MQKDRYLELLKSALINELYPELEAQLLLSVLCARHGLVMELPEFWAIRSDVEFIEQILEAKESGETILLDTSGAADAMKVDESLRNYSEFSYSLVGRKRLDHLQACVEDVLEKRVPGDFLEAGVWRGGCCILMRAVLVAHGCEDRNVWLADSFSGMPLSARSEDLEYEMDKSRLPFLAVTMDEVKRNFDRFELLDEQVRFIPGWFDQSLRRSDTGPLSLLRVDCDLYSSTWSALTELYPRLSRGGWVIIDDYGILPPCQQAVDDFRDRHGVTEELERIDEHAVCWKKES
jgi:hypothetical protein